jgi:hypothetical protein
MNHCYIFTATPRSVLYFTGADRPLARQDLALRATSTPTQLLLRVGLQVLTG